ncbi:MAG: ribonuclease J [Armatimonadetes bacterium]|nr:ribonuclease J [Armatimonadota bacterium]MDE2206011.1 ribonuclease J [Armatimonadota bacterium]
MLAFVYGETIVLVDAGVMFGNDEFPGVDLIIPDISWLAENREHVRGICLTHGHEDHIGALPYVLRQIQAPIYGTALTLGMARGKLSEHGLASASTLIEFGADPVILGELQVTAIHVTHSLPDAVSLAIGSPAGIVVHTSDFKLDASPIDGRLTDLSAFARFGDQGVRLLISDSVNVERKGWSPSEQSLVPVFDRYIRDSRGRIIVATFGSNLHRLQTVFNVAHRYGRKVAVYGRSMVQNVDIARQLGFIRFEDSDRIKPEDINQHHPGEIVICTTGSQGEPLAGLTRMSRDDNTRIHIDPTDTIILSSTPIPGNEDMVWRVVNRLFRRGANVIYDQVQNVHVSGHGYQEELKMMINLVRAHYVAPYHGEPRHYHAFRDMAIEMGYEEDQIVTFETGQMLVVNDDGVHMEPSPAQTGSVLVDSTSAAEISDVVLRDRRHLSQDGTVVVTVSIDRATGEILAGPDILSRGFLTELESVALFEEARQKVVEALAELSTADETDRDIALLAVQDTVARFLRRRTNKRPVVVPVVMEV